MNSFYVYILLDPRKPGFYKYGDFVFDHEPFYVGKGRGNRYKEHLGYLSQSSYNSFIANKIRKIFKECNTIYISNKIFENLFEEVAFEVEKFLIRQIGRFDLKRGPLCNLTDGGEGMSGHVCSKETRIKLSNCFKGTKHPMFNKHHREDSKNKMSIGNTGRVFSEEHRKKISLANRGKIRSEDCKKRLSEINKGNKRSEETKKKMREQRIGCKNPNFGKVTSEETKRKISESLKRRNSIKRQLTEVLM